MARLPENWKSIIEKANSILEIEPLPEYYYMLQGHRGLRTDCNGITLADALSLTTLLIRLVENVDMRELEHRFDKTAGAFKKQPGKKLWLLVEVIFDTVIELHKENILVIWQPLPEPLRGEVLVNGN